MAAITAASVKSLREKTGLPMMDCKKALQESDGNIDGAIELLRKAGKKTMEKRAGRSTSSGRIAIYCDPSVPVGTIIELQCESDPVATNEKFIALANNLAKQLAIGPGATTPDELLEQVSPDGSGETLKQQFEDLNNQIREVFKLSRIERIDGICGGYAHHNAAAAVLLQIEGEVSELVKDISMHTAAMRPEVIHVDELDAEKVAKEREILSEAARQEGKPEKIIEKMVEGRLRNYYSEVCLAEQEFVKDNTKTVGKVAEEAGMKLVKFIHWELPKE